MTSKEALSGFSPFFVPAFGPYTAASTIVFPISHKIKLKYIKSRTNSDYIPIEAKQKKKEEERLDLETSEQSREPDSTGCESTREVSADSRCARPYDPPFSPSLIFPTLKTLVKPF